MEVLRERGCTNLLKVVTLLWFDENKYISIHLRFSHFSIKFANSSWKLCQCTYSICLNLNFKKIMLNKKNHSHAQGGEHCVRLYHFCDFHHCICINIALWLC